MIHSLAILSILSMVAGAAFAGDVTVAVKKGVLKVTGTAAADHIMLSTEGEPLGSIAVWPKFGMGTTVNGSSTGTSFPGVKDVRIDLRSGDDSVGGGAYVPRDLNVDLGAGNDDLYMICGVGRDARVELGSGTDTLEIKHFVVKDDFEIDAGDGWGTLKLFGGAVGGDVVEI